MNTPKVKVQLTERGATLYCYGECSCQRCGVLLPDSKQDIKLSPSGVKAMTEVCKMGSDVQAVGIAPDLGVTAWSVEGGADAFVCERCNKKIDQENYEYEMQMCISPFAGIHAMA